MFTEKLLRPAQAASLLGVSTGTLKMWRYSNFGPAHVELSDRTIRYRTQDLEEWLQSRTVKP